MAPLAFKRVVEAEDAAEQAAFQKVQAPVEVSGEDDLLGSVGTPAISATPAPSEASDDEIALQPVLGRCELRLPTDEDVDRLWDWVRVDDTPIQDLLKARTSLDLHAKVRQLAALEAHGTALVRAIVWNGEHVGFGSLNPIQEGTGLAHVYLNPARRGIGVLVCRMARQVLREQYPTLRLTALVGNKRIALFARRAGLARVQFLLTEME